MCFNHEPNHASASPRENLVSSLIYESNFTMAARRALSCSSLRLSARKFSASLFGKRSSIASILLLRRVSGFFVGVCAHSGGLLLKYFCTKKKFFIKTTKNNKHSHRSTNFFLGQKKTNLYKNLLDKLLFYKKY